MTRFKKKSVPTMVNGPVGDNPLTANIRAPLRGVAAAAGAKIGLSGDEMLDILTIVLTEQLMSTYSTLDLPTRAKIDHVLASGALATMLTDAATRLEQFVAGTSIGGLFGSLLGGVEISIDTFDMVLDRAAAGEYGALIAGWVASARNHITAIFSAACPTLQRLRSGALEPAELFDALLARGAADGAVSVAVCALAKNGCLGVGMKKWAEEMADEGTTRLQRRLQQAVELVIKFGSASVISNRPLAEVVVEMANAGLIELMLDAASVGALGDNLMSMALNGELETMLQLVLSPGLSLRIERLGVAWAQFEKTLQDEVADVLDQGNQRKKAKKTAKKKKKKKGEKPAAHPAALAIEMLFGELVSFLGSGVAGDAAKRLVLVPEAMDQYTGEGVVPDDELKPPFSQINGSIKSAGAHSGMILSGIEMLTSTGRMLHGLWSAIVGEPKPGEVLYRITVLTTPKSPKLQGTGTDANVCVVVVGNDGKTDELKLSKSSHRDKFEPGQQDVFLLRALPVGDHLDSLIVSHDNSGFFTDAAWHVASIEVEIFSSAKLPDDDADEPDVQTKEMFAAGVWISKRSGLTVVLRPATAADVDLANADTRRLKVAHLLEKQTDKGGSKVAQGVAKKLLRTPGVSMSEVVTLVLDLHGQSDPVCSTDAFRGLVTAVRTSKKHELLDLFRALFATAERAVVTLDALAALGSFGELLERPKARTVARSIVSNSVSAEGRSSALWLLALIAEVGAVPVEARVGVVLGPSVLDLRQPPGVSVDPTQFLIDTLDFRQSPRFAWAVDCIAETGIFGKAVQDLAERGSLTMTPGSIVNQLKQLLESSLVAKTPLDAGDDGLDRPCPPGLQIGSVGFCMLALNGLLGANFEAMAAAGQLQQNVAKLLQGESRARMAKLLQLMLEAVGRLRSVPSNALGWQYGAQPPLGVPLEVVRFSAPAASALKDGEFGVSVLTVGRKLCQVSVPADCTVKQLRNRIARQHAEIPAGDRRVRFAPVNRFIEDSELLTSVGVTSGSCVRLCRKLPPICLDMIHEVDEIADTGALGVSAHKFFQSFIFECVEETLDIFAHGFIAAVFDGDSDVEQDADIKRTRRRDMMRSLCSRVMTLQREATGVLSADGNPQLTEEDQLDLYVQDVTATESTDGAAVLKPALEGLFAAIRAPPVAADGTVNPVLATMRRIFRRQGIWINDVRIVVPKPRKDLATEVRAFPPLAQRVMHEHGTQPREFNVGKRSARVALVLTKAVIAVEFEQSDDDDSEEEVAGFGVDDCAPVGGLANVPDAGADKGGKTRREKKKKKSGAKYSLDSQNPAKPAQSRCTLQ